MNGILCLHEWLFFWVNVGRYTIHWGLGYYPLVYVHIHEWLVFHQFWCGYTPSSLMAWIKKTHRSNKNPRAALHLVVTALFLFWLGPTLMPRFLQEMPGLIKGFLWDHGDWGEYPYIPMNCRTYHITESYSTAHLDRLLWDVVFRFLFFLNDLYANSFTLDAEKIIIEEDIQTIKVYLRYFLERTNWCLLSRTHRIHVWYVYLRLPYKSTTCRQIYHTRMVCWNTYLWQFDFFL